MIALYALTWGRNAGLEIRRGVMTLWLIEAVLLLSQEGSGSIHSLSKEIQSW